MTSSDIKNEIKGLIYGAGSNVAKVADALGTSAQNLNQKIARGTLRYSEYKQILDLLGYKFKLEKK